VTLLASNLVTRASPGRQSQGVEGPPAERVAQAAVGCISKAHPFGVSRCTRYRGQPGFGQEHSRLREAVSVFTHLSEKGRRQDNTQAWEGQEQSGVRMTLQQLINCSLKGFQLPIQQSQLLNQGECASSFAGRRTGGSRKQVGSKSFDQTVSGLPTSITVGHKKA